MKNKSIIPLIIVLALIGVALYALGNKEEVIVAPENKEAIEDPRIAEYLASEEAKLQARLSIYEQDRLDILESDRLAVKAIEKKYNDDIAAQKLKRGAELKRINGQLDAVRQALLGTTTVKGNQITSLARKVTRAIGLKETGLTPDCHTNIGGSGERFCYQLMPSTWRSYSIQVLGYYEEAPSPVTVEYVVTSKIQQFINKGTPLEYIPLKWNAGELATRCSHGVNKYGVKYDSCSYVQKVMNYYKQLQ